MDKVFERIHQAIANNEKGVVLTVIQIEGSSLGRLGDKMLVLASGETFGTIGGGRAEYEAVREVQRNWKRRDLWRKRYDLDEKGGMLCGGSMEVLFEPIGTRERMVIFGAGHVGEILARLAPQSGFWTVVVDHREEFANKEALPLAHQIICAPYARALKQVELDESTYVVVVTNSHAYDALVLKHCAPQKLAYLGAIGSATKTKKILGDLAREGIPPEMIEKIRMPIGLNLGAQTPFEIAVSIMAEIIAVKYAVDVQSVSMKTAFKEGNG